MKKAMERILSPRSEIRKDEKGTLLIPSHQQIASISMSIPKGKVITEDMLRETLAKKMKVDRVCQLATPWFIKELGDYYQFLKKRFGKIIPLDVLPPWLLSSISTYYSGGFRYITIDNLPPIWRIVGDNGELDGHFYNLQKYMLKQEIEGLKLEYVKGKKPERKVFGSGRKIVRHPERIQNFQQYLVD
jgi:hypothetical protein